MRVCRPFGLKVSTDSVLETATIATRKAPSDGMRVWAARNNVTYDVIVPPFGFERDAGYCRALATSIQEFATSIIIMAVGAPHSEIGLDSNPALLPSCWAFCVGQAVKIELGLVQRASSKWQLVGMEWLWRLLQEPSRLTKRYIVAGFGFGIAVVEDQPRSRRAGS